MCEYKKCVSKKVIFPLNMGSLMCDKKLRRTKYTETLLCCNDVIQMRNNNFKSVDNILNRDHRIVSSVVDTIIGIELRSLINPQTTNHLQNDRSLFTRDTELEQIEKDRQTQIEYDSDKSRKLVTSKDGRSTYTSWLP